MWGSRNGEIREYFIRTNEHETKVDSVRGA